MFWILISTSLMVAGFSSELQSVILVSELTPSSWVSDFKSLSQCSYKIPILQLSNSTIPTSELLNKNLIFDFTESLHYQSKLKNFANSHGILYFSNREDSFPDYSKREFYLHPPPLVEAKALRVLLDYLNLTDFHLLSSPTLASKTISSFLSSSSPETFSSDLHQEVFDRYTARVIKASGNWKAVFTGEEQGASKLLQAFENTRIFKERSVIVLTSNTLKAGGQVGKLGTIGITEEGLEEAASEGEFEFKAVIRVLKILDNLAGDLRGSVVRNELLARKLEENNPDHIVSTRYSIVNFKDTLQIVGTIGDNTIEIKEEIVFPGNVSQINNSPPEVLISANTGPHEWDDSFNYLAIRFSSGLQPMVEIVNNDSSILPTFNLRLHETDCGFGSFNYEYTSKCMEKHRDKLGLAHLSTIRIDIIESYLRLFKEYNLKMPTMGILIKNNTAYDKTLFPEVLITTPEYTNYYIILPYIIKNLGWKRIILIYNKNIDPLYKFAFTYNAEILEIDIVNPSDFMYVPFVKTKSYYEEVKPILQYIKKAKCRIIVLLVDPTSHLFFMEALYDFGFRRGEVIFIYISTLSSFIDSPETYNFDRKKVLELADGSLAMDVPHYVGEYGEQLQKQIASMIFPQSTDGTCYRIDSLMLAVRSIDLMIQAGADLEDFDQIMYFMRGVRFTGCSGQISIDSSGNGLRDIVYHLFNFYDTKEGWKQYRIGSYTVGITVPLKFNKDIVWPEGRTETPSDTIEDPECGFPEDLVSTNETSRKISVLLTTTPLVCVCIVSFFVYRRFRDIKREFLEKKRDMYFEDGVFLYLPLLESLQIIGLGPGFYTASLFLSYLIFELESRTDFKYEIFWMAIYVGSGICFVWSVCFILSSFDLEKKLPGAAIRSFIEVVGFTFIPFFSRALFVPLNVVLLNIYDCKKGIGEEPTLSFLDKDCKTWCWEDKQLVFAIGITFLLTLYNCLAIISAVFYDEAKEYVSVKTQILYAFLKPIYLLILVCLRFNLKNDFEWAFLVSYWICVFSWAMLAFKIETYNYKRLNMWTRVFSGSICSHQVLILVYRIWNIPELVLAILDIVLVLAGAGIGFYFQLKHFPSMLNRKKGRNFDKLLRFAFTGKVKARELTVHQLDYKNNIVVE